MTISSKQLATFDRRGYLVLKDAIPTSLLRDLRQSYDTIQQQLLENAQFDGLVNNVAILHQGNQNFISRIDNLFSFDIPLFVKLLGLPLLQQAVQALVEGDAIPIYESLLIKHKGDNQNIDWHRDMNHQRDSRIFTVGVYLDDSKSQQGALQVIPHSHLSPDSVCEITRRWQQGDLTSAEVTTEAGDIVIHDVMLVHSSPPINEEARRRTVYFEFRSLEHTQANPLFSASWIQQRQELNRYACHLWSQSPASTTDNEFKLQDLYKQQVRYESAEYCFEPPLG
ncbi:phytanoyl-CoA dioxygenase family protein [Vibrio variabilis]|uniref:phytanoyl-CoA dioxygenase family protein n=1 Tax=Vibrio variabilis TaxID=990271 RepID=UPI000DD86C2A|nr:phytanoyl-CoA dioxygenase family protein [Vibrio variabilis]